LNKHNHITDFQRRVYDALMEVPAGRVTTYGLLARRIGCRAPRAIGQALRRNPFAPCVPCHRVIASDLTPGGFTGHAEGPEIARKLRLLAKEGVVFDAATGRLAAPEQRVFRPASSPCVHNCSKQV
jgi:methylated-DNA-[protein]-cysteine S-methyltransferase